MVFPMKSSVLDRISRLGKVSALFAFAALVSACGAGSEREARIEFVTLRLTPALDARDREALADLLVAPSREAVETAARQRAYFETVETPDLRGVATRLAARIGQITEGGFVGLVSAEEVLASREREADVVDDVTLARRIMAAQLLAPLVGADSVPVELDGAEIRVGDAEKPILRFRLSGESPDYAIELIR